MAYYGETAGARKARTISATANLIDQYMQGRVKQREAEEEDVQIRTVGDDLYRVYKSGREPELYLEGPGDDDPTSEEIEASGLQRLEAILGGYGADTDEGKAVQGYIDRYETAAKTSEFTEDVVGTYVEQAEASVKPATGFKHGQSRELKKEDRIITQIYNKHTDTWVDTLDAPRFKEGIDPVTRSMLTRGIRQDIKDMQKRKKQALTIQNNPEFSPEQQDQYLKQMGVDRWTSDDEDELEEMESYMKMLRKDAMGGSDTGSKWSKYKTK